MATSEFDLIKRCFLDQGLGFSRSGIELGIGDDCALLSSPNNLSLALSIDTLVAGIHFPADAPPAQIAHRALAVNLSDLAAMAAQPLGFTLALTLPHSDVDWVEQFAQGLLPLAQEFNCPLIGGDTTRGPLTITLQVHGEVDPRLALRRDAARADQPKVQSHLERREAASLLHVVPRGDWLGRHLDLRHVDVARGSRDLLLGGLVDTERARRHRALNCQAAFSNHFFLAREAEIDGAETLRSRCTDSRRPSLFSTVQHIFHRWHHFLRQPDRDEITCRSRRAHWTSRGQRSDALGKKWTAKTRSW